MAAGFLEKERVTGRERRRGKRERVKPKMGKEMGGGRCVCMISFYKFLSFFVSVECSKLSVLLPLFFFFSLFFPPVAGCEHGIYRGMKTCILCVIYL